MVTLTVWQFGDPPRAERTLGTLAVEQFIRPVQDRVRPGTSALPACTNDARPAQVHDGSIQFAQDGHLVGQNQTDEPEAVLREVLA